MTDPPNCSTTPAPSRSRSPPSASSTSPSPPSPPPTPRHDPPMNDKGLHASGGTLTCLQIAGVVAQISGTVTRRETAAGVIPCSLVLAPFSSFETGIGAEFGQGLRRERAGEDPREVQDPHARQRARRLRVRPGPGGFDGSGASVMALRPWRHRRVQRAPARAPGLCQRSDRIGARPPPAWERAARRCVRDEQA